MTAASAAANQKYVRRLDLRVEFDVIAATAPSVGRVTEEILDLIIVTLHLTELLTRHVHEGVLFAMWIEIDHNENDVVARSGHLAVKQNRVVVGRVEP